MILVLNPKATKAQVTALEKQLTAKGLRIHESIGESSHIIGLIGDVSQIEPDWLLASPIVDQVKRISDPFKKANRKMHPDDSIITVGNTKIGGGHFAVMAGPCSIESQRQVQNIASDVLQAGADILRGGAFKPRTSPYAFQGMRCDGLNLLSKAKAHTGMPIVSEIMKIEDLPLFDDVDLLQVGARNMQNFELLKALGQQPKPILLKRGLSATIEEWLMSAEYILAGGNEQVILCERGIRTFETATRNTLDISAIPIVKKLSHLPIIVDPSHASGKAQLVHPLAMAAIAAGADGLMIEVHNDPKHALCDGAQSLTPQQFELLMADVKRARAFFSQMSVEQ